MNEYININFIIPNNCESENDCSEEMQLAFTACEQHSGGGIKARWVHQSQWNKFDGLTKRDVFVLPEFEGDLFKKLKATKCLLVGPRCLSCCLMEGTPIPSGIEPVFTIAMKNLVVTASGLSKQQKEHIKQRVQWMGGIYTTVLSEDTTHLISDTVLSDKYIKSVEKGIPIMKDSWVDAVWEASLHFNISGSCSDFDGYKLPPFANLQITTSGILKKEKQNIMKLVNENGGVFSGAFQSEITDVVVLAKDGIGSDKYKAALEYNKAIVLPSWIADSVAKGVALPAFKYRVAGASTSSPLAEHRLPDMSLNFSRISNLRPQNNFVDETRSVDISTMSARMKLSQDTKRSSDSSLDKDTLAEFEKFDMSLIKKAGPIFDGFCIWIINLDGLLRDRISACISRCGGIRFDTPHARVTHVVAGSMPAGGKEAKQLSSVPVLSPTWVLRSVVAGRVLDESDFLMNTKPATPKKSQSRIEPASPMSKRNLQLLLHQTPSKLNLPPQVIEEVDLEDDVVNQYLNQNMPEPQVTPDPPPVREVQPDITEDTMADVTEEVEQIFRGVKIAVEGLDTEAICEIGAELAAAGGVLVASGAPSDYTLVPLDWEEGERCVTVFWIKDCISQQEVLPIQYYHRPVKLNFDGTPPLVGVVASLSTYSGVERAFLDELAKLLGAVTQLRFCRRNTATALASTHLICPTPTGDKYSGALKWSLPAVTASWLLKCAAAGRRVGERDYLVGDTRAPPSPEKNEIIEDKQTDEQIKTVEKDKENDMLPPPTNLVRRGSSNREQTPKGKIGISENDPDNMSPASRYIAMARQGLLGSDSQETPKRLQELKDDDRQGDTTVRTPSLEDALSTPNLLGLSPTTRRRLQAVRRGEMPSDPIRTPVDPFDKNPETPDSAFGAALRPGSGRLSPDGRKRLWKIVSDLPSKEVQLAKDKHTPLSEVRNRFLAQFNGDAPTPPSEHHVMPRKLQLQDQAETPPPKIAKLSEHQSAGGLNITEDTSNVTPKAASSASTPSHTLPAAVDQQLQRLNAALSNRLSSQKKRARDSVATLPVPEVEAGPDSQINTVGWDDTAPPVKTFMLSSNVDNREEITEMITHLGGVPSVGAELDPRATHLLCAAPARSEKMLGSVAAGRWVLHPAYVVRSRAAGRFVDEQEYEWGNPLATSLPQVSGAESALARAAYKWRTTRARGEPGAFSGTIALLHVPEARKRLLARLIEAGDGVVSDDEPPYSDKNITVCFADIKRYPLSARDSSWLVSNRIPVCPPVLLSSYLTDDAPPDPVLHCLPDFTVKQCA